MTEELFRKYVSLRAHKLGLNGALSFLFADKAVAHWAAGKQCETALQEAAKELGRA
jgi:hypothetical protein